MKKTKTTQPPAITLTENEISSCFDRLACMGETIGNLGITLQTIDARLEDEAGTLPGWIIAQIEMCHWQVSQINAHFEALHAELFRKETPARNLAASAAPKK